MLSAKFDFVGIDYGSKLAGTTALCYYSDDKFFITQSEKKKDADQWLKEQLTILNPQKIYIDAPLSLPDAYFGKGTDYFYRESDRLCKAMSPMFLGGLTARAMRLKNELNQFSFYESYPGALAREVYKLGEFYNKKSILPKQSTECLRPHIPTLDQPCPVNWHQFDAILCWLTGYRHANNESLVLGNIEEGVIIV